MNAPSDFISHTAMSECCGLAAMGEIVNGWGVCIGCKEHAYFPGEVDADETAEEQGTTKDGVTIALSPRRIRDVREHSAYWLGKFLKIADRAETMGPHETQKDVLKLRQEFDNFNKTKTQETKHQEKKHEKTH